MIVIISYTEWWNPFVYLLRNQIANMLELRVDYKVVSQLEEEQALEYMKCLIKMARLNAKKHYFSCIACDKCCLSTESGYF